jgi:PAS domain S-box-containing protein
MSQGTAAHFANREPLTATGSRNHFRLGEWKIRTLLRASFAVIVLLMIVGDVIAVLQLHRVEIRASGFYQADQKPLAIMQVYVDVVTFRETLTALAHDQHPREFVSQATSLRDNFLRDVAHAQQTLSSTRDLSREPTILSRLEAVRAALPSQIDTMLELVKTGDWQAVRFRLAGQVPPLIGLSSSLVADVGQEVAQERAQALESIQRTRRQLYLVLPITALLILLMAAMLGWYATRRISKPLAQLHAGAQALARGEFGYKVELRGDDELADLARAFNYAAQQLHKLYDVIKRSEAYLAESNFRLEEAQRITHVGCWEWDLATDCLIWSDETYRIFGLQPQEPPMTVDALRELVHAEDRDFVFREAEETLRGARHDVEYRIVRPSGEVRIVNSTRAVRKDASGRPVQIFGTVQDITDRKRAEEALQQSQLYLAEGQRLAHMGSWTFNAAGFSYWSPELFQVHGIDPRGKPPTVEEYLALVHPEDHAFMKQGIAKMLDDHLAFDFTKRIVRPDGEIRWIRCVGVPVTQGGTFQGFVGTGMDVTEQERLTEELRESERYLSEGQRLAHMGSWAFSPSGFFEYWSQELFEIYGLDPQKEAPTLEQYLATVHPQDRDFMAETIKRMRAERSGCDVKKRIVRPDGEHRYIRCVGIPVIEDEMLKGFLGTAIDITEQELLTQELERRQAYLAEAQILSHTGSFGWKPDSGEIVWSDETYCIFEYNPAEKLTLDRIMERVHPEDRHLALEVVEPASNTSGVVDFKLRLLFPDGRVKYIRVLVRPLGIANDNLEFAGAIIDRTEAQLAEERIRQNEAELRLLIDAIPQQVAVFDSAWKPLFANRQAQEYTGLSPQEFQSIAAIDRLIQPDDLGRVHRNRERATRETAPAETEARIRGKDGIYRWFLLRAYPLQDSQGRVLRWYATRTDITELKSAEQERERLRQLEADLAHTDRVSTLGEMAASLAHEIKQPIAAAITSANSCIEWLAHEPPNLDRARAAAARIDKYGNRAAEIIDHIRSFYKKSPPQRELIEVNGIIHELLTLLEGEATRSSIAMLTDLSAELPKIMVDRVQLQQVFMNLMLNAIEAMKDSGGELTVKSELQDGQLQFSVSDTGVGLPTEKMDQIFSAFFTTKPQGSGMGLAISRSIVESHGGQLWATTNRGGGATFHFTLPIQVTEPSPLVA